MADAEFLAKWDQDINDINCDKKQLYEKMLEQFDKDGQKNVDLCWRLVQAAIVLADGCEKNKKKDEAKKWIEKSFEHAKKCIELDAKSMNAHKWYCASIGRISEHVGTKERIKFGHEFKEHRDIAVEMDPNDQLMHHMYGRWCHEVASLSYIERKIAETFFATPPKATYEDALESFKKADALKHEWKLNHWCMAKTYAAMKKYEQCIECIDAGLAFPINTEEDGMAHEEMKTMEKSYAKYRSKK